MTATVDDTDLALMGMIPKQILAHLSPTELAARITASRQILAEADLKGTDRQVALRDVKKLLTSIPVKTYLTVASPMAKLANASKGNTASADIADALNRELWTLTRSNPAVALFFSLPDDIRVQILAEITSAS